MFTFPSRPSPSPCSFLLLIASLALVLSYTSSPVVANDELARIKSLSTSSEFIGCLGASGEYTPKSGIKVKKQNEKRSYYECAESCAKKGKYPYSYYTDKGKGVHTCSCSTAGPEATDYVVQPVGSFGCRLGQTRAALTATDQHFIVCSTGFIGDFTDAGFFSTPLECLTACENLDSEGALFLPLSLQKRYETGEQYGCRCGGVTSVRTVAACGQEGAEFSYVYKPTNRKKASGSGAGKGKGKGATISKGRKKLGSGSGATKEQEGEKKVYENPCDDPDSILGYCGFGEEDQPVFHDRTNL